MTFDMANEIVSGAYPWSGGRVLVTGGAGFRKQADLTKLNAKMPAYRQTVNREEGLADMIEWHERNRLAGVFDESAGRPAVDSVSR